MQINRFRMAYQMFWRLLLRIILIFVGRLTIHGRENLPPAGPYIIISNHMSKVDPPIIMLAFPRQQMRVFAASKWRNHPLFGTILGLAGAIWVKRGEVDRQALRDAIGALKEGQVLGMAPEGTRSKTASLQKARQGAAYIATRAHVPLLPIGIANSDIFRRNVVRFRRTPFEVNIGRLFTLPDLDPRPKGKELDACTELIMGQIAALLPERYHGYYVDSPVLAAIRAGGDPWPAACQAAGLEFGDEINPAGNE